MSNPAAAAHNRRMKSFYFALIVVALLGACEREGPAERAGKQVDRAAEDVRDAVKDATI